MLSANEIISETMPTTDTTFSSVIYSAAVPTPLTNSTMAASCAYAFATIPVLKSETNTWTGENAFSSGITTTPNSFIERTDKAAPVLGQIGYFPATTALSDSFVVVRTDLPTLIRALPNTGTLLNTAPAVGTIPAGTYIFLYRQQFQHYINITNININIGMGLSLGGTECFYGSYLFKGSESWCAVNAVGFYQSATPFNMYIWGTFTVKPYSGAKVNFYASYMRIA